MSRFLLKDNEDVEITPKNVVIMSIQYPQYSEGIVIGSGSVWVFTEGKYVQGTWSRVSPDEPVKLLDDSGSVIKLSRGQTFVELMPDSMNPNIA